MKEEKLSFAKEVKNEIVSLPWEDELKRSLLSGFVKINGSLRLSNRKTLLELSSESKEIAKAIYSYISDLYGVNISFAYTKDIGARKRVKYHVLVDEADYILGDLEVDLLESKIPHNAVANEYLSGAYLAGAFLAGGSINSPETSNYHLEIATSDEIYAKWLSKLINKFQSHRFDSKVIQRRKKWIVYLKRGEQISDFLISIGATSSCLKFENERIDRDFSNIGNRLANLDGANFRRSEKASKKQIEEIEYLLENKGNEYFDDPKVKALIDLRLEHEDASMQELSILMSEQLNSTISKSNINHIFRKLHEEYIKAHG